MSEHSHSHRKKKLCQHSTSKLTILLQEHMPKIFEAMIEYKNSEFFTNYFSNLKDFKLLKPFEEENHVFVSEMEAIGTIHPINIRIEIPESFPYHKLTFYTKSLWGYPHLIGDAGDKGSWFCLNTPFAETAEEQLKQELNRLREWIKLMLREDLPAIIDDYKVRESLLMANSFGWELDAYNLREFYKNPNIVIIDNVPDITEDVGEIGQLSGVWNSGTMFICNSRIKSKYNNINYIVVDHEPTKEEMRDTESLQQAYGWSYETCSKLFGVGVKKSELTTGHSIKLIGREKSKASQERNKTWQYETVSELIADTREPIKYRDLIKKELDSGDIDNEGCHKYFKEDLPICETQEDFDNLSDEELEDYRIQSEIDNYIETPKYFALFVKGEAKRNWIFFGFYVTSNSQEILKEYEFSSGSFIRIAIQHYDYQLEKMRANVIDYRSYFGRGCLTDKLINSKIAIIGVGAVGSMLAESLARGGCKHFGLWDGDKVEPGNICRSEYGISDLGNNKAKALQEHLNNISPFCDVEALDDDLYGEVNYASQDDIAKELAEYDIVFDCTASNELLHFLSYTITDKSLVSLCITNHAYDLLCISNHDGNVYELRKAYLERIKQDTENYYAEGYGCFSPTFLASSCDISSLVSMAVRDMNKSIAESNVCHSVIWSYKERGVVGDRIHTYKLRDIDITLSVSSEVLLDGSDMPDVANGNIGYIFGSYSTDGKHIFITHIIGDANVEDDYRHIRDISNGSIDYIGDVYYSGADTISGKDGRTKIIELIANKAADPSINTNNPLVALRDADYQLEFYLYINGQLTPFTRQE